MNGQRIHKDNYEAFLLDRAEGSLSPELLHELEMFLVKNPQLAMDTEGFQDVSLAADPVSFGPKRSIRKSEHDLVSDELLVAYLEGQLDKKEKTFVEKSISGNPGLKTQLALYERTILQADAGIIYPSRSSLKRRNKVIWFSPDYMRYAAAAVLLLFVGLAFIWNYKANSGEPSLAGKTPAIQHPLDAPALIAQKNNGVHIEPAPAKQAVKPVSSSLPGNAVEKQSQVKPEMPVNQQEKVLQQPGSLIANNAAQEQEPAAVTATAIPQPVNPKEEITSAASNKTKVLTVVEEEEEEGAASKKKSVLWAMAGKALRGLNKAGLKTVDGEEKDSRQATDYQLTLGGFHVTHSENLD